MLPSVVYLCFSITSFCLAVLRQNDPPPPAIGPLLEVLDLTINNMFENEEWSLFTNTSIRNLKSTDFAILGIRVQDISCISVSTSFLGVMIKAIMKSNWRTIKMVKNHAVMPGGGEKLHIFVKLANDWQTQIHVSFCFCLVFGVGWVVI